MNTADAKPKYKFKNAVTAENLQEFIYQPINITDQFDNKKRFIVFWIYFEDVRSSINVRSKWITPRKEIFKDNNFFIEDPPQGLYYTQYIIYYIMEMSDFISPANYGKWSIEIYIDNKKKKRLFFTLNPPPLRFYFPVSFYGPYDAEISAVLDHSGPFNKRDGVVLSYTGEQGRREYGADCYDKTYNEKLDESFCKKNAKKWGYKKNDGQDFSLPGMCKYLYYDGSSGYEFPAERDPIIAPANGILCIATSNTKNNGAMWRNKNFCPHKKDPITKMDWNKNHAFYIIHDNIYTTWYSYTDELYYKVRNQILERGYAVIEVEDYIGFTGEWGFKTDTFSRLYFSVRKGEKNIEVVDPYGWENQPTMWVDEDYFE